MVFLYLFAIGEKVTEVVFQTVDIVQNPGNKREHGWSLQRKVLIKPYFSKPASYYSKKRL